MQIDVEGDELTAPRERLIGHAQQGSFAIRALAVAGALDDLFPPQRVSLVPSR
jgi:hypothetical protein